MPQIQHQNIMRTTPTLDEDVDTKLRALCRRTGESFETVVNRTLREGLDARASRTPTQPFRVQARPLRLRTGIDLDDVAELLERIDGPEHS